MNCEHITQPGQIGALEIKNRISLSPMEKNWCDRLGNPGQNYIEYYALRAKHGVGSMNFEATYIDARGRGNLYQLGLWSDDNIPAHKRLNEAVQAYGCRTTAELNHGGRNANTHRTGLQPVGPSNNPFPMVGGHELHALSIDEIKKVVGRYRAGARRAAEAGYDMIAIHGAHGYLVTNFLSYIHNTRTDEYGGNDVNRWRFLTEIYQAMRDEVGKEMPIGLRLSAREEVKDGYGIDYAIRLTQHLAAKGLDFIDVSTGLYESIETLIQPMDTRSGCLMPLARQFKEKVSIPVISAGRINQIAQAEKIIAQGDCDYVHMGRAFHADPELLSKTLADRVPEVVSCIACNKCCMELFHNRPSVCTVNPAAGRERLMEIRPAERSRSVMVAGGGLSGLEAARMAAERGHNVTLYEKSDRLGGFVNVLGAPRHGTNWLQAVKDRVAMARRAGVNIRMQSECTPDVVTGEKPDVLIAATGSVPFVPKYIPGWDCDIVTDYQAVLFGNEALSGSVVVVGGQWLGMALAETLADRGAQVTVIEATNAIAQDLEYMAQQVMHTRLDNSNQIRIRLETNVEEIYDDSLLLQSKGTIKKLENVEKVVFALERAMDRTLIEELTSTASLDHNMEVHMIGDCVWPQDPYGNILDGNSTGRAI